MLCALATLIKNLELEKVPLTNKNIKNNILLSFNKHKNIYFCNINNAGKTKKLN